MNRRVVPLLVLILFVLAATYAYFRRQTSQGTTNPTSSSASITPNSSGIQEPTPSRNIVETLSDIGAFRYLVAAIKLSDSNSKLTTDGPYTIFAPPDDALSGLLDNPQQLVKDTSKLNSIVQYHIVMGKVTANDLLKSPTLKALNGQDLHVKVNGQTVTIENSRIIDVDIPATNGIIHVIDAPLIPPK